MESFMYFNPTKLLFGRGQLSHLPKEVSAYGKKVLLVYGGGSIKKNGLYNQIITLLEQAEIEWVELSGVEPNPRVTTVRKGIALCKRENIEFVLAVGGGSVIDCVKAIVVGAKTDRDVWDIISRKSRAEDGLPYGSVVTISGTGAEMSLTSVISDWETKEKRAWVSSFSRAKFSIVDPSFMTTVPREQTVNGIVDTMSHILEHYFHTGKNTPIQDQFCESVLRTLIDVTPKLLEDLDNYELRETIAYASTIALSDQLNMGFVGDWATHHIDHALSAVHDIPHGGGMAILYPHWMKYVFDKQNVNKFSQLAINVLGIDATGKTKMEIAEKGIEALAHIWTSWGAPSKLSEYDITDETLPLIAQKTLEAAPKCGNFKRLSETDVLAILNSSL
ncbi:iron-containing alcohol dehydrogenase [Pseudogracilibacillus sp. SE30717A]|uniref:iron-containing alcohol dehydrogenase n=1 Tax=Pseudogracilibacillus sp. SE30717A TaxID=3098293 RepID=UPI00300E5BDA